MRRRFVRTRKAFTLVEILVAMVVLAIGLLGMAAMTVMVTKGNRGASDLTSATNVCQLKVEELKDVDWDALGNWSDLGNSSGALPVGWVDGGMAQEGSFDWSDVTGDSEPDPGGLNSQGKTFEDVWKELGQNAEAVGLAKQRGPFNIVRTFVICKGSDYPGHPAEGSVSPGGDLNPAYLDCSVDPANALSTRVEGLACKDEDIAMTQGPGSTEKKIKVLCAWKDRSGQCHSVKLDTTVVDLGS